MATKMDFKRYMVFVVEAYEPRGGLLDVKGDFDTLEEAVPFAKKEREDQGGHGWVDLFDRVAGIEICRECNSTHANGFSGRCLSCTLKHQAACEHKNWDNGLDSCLDCGGGNTRK